MPAAQKQKYVDEAAKAKKELTSEKDKLLSSKSEKEKQELTEAVKSDRLSRRRILKKMRTRKLLTLLNKPKRPFSSFGLYMKTLDRGEAPVTQFTKGASMKWKALPAQDKEVHRVILVNLKKNR